MTFFKLDLELEDLLQNGEHLLEKKNQKATEEYIKKNRDDIIQAEQEMLEQRVKNKGIDALLVIRDNRHELYITDGNGEEIFRYGYYVEINI